MNHEPILSPHAVAQFRWLVAALRNEPYAESREQQDDLARRLELALAGGSGGLEDRLGRTLTTHDGSLLARLARWHEEMASRLPPSPEETTLRARAHRFREISQIMRIWV